MGEFSVSTGIIRVSSEEIRSMLQGMRGCAVEIESIRAGLPFSVGRANVDGLLRNAVAHIGDQTTKTSLCVLKLEHIAEAYETTEELLTGNPSGLESYLAPVTSDESAWTVTDTLKTKPFGMAGGLYANGQDLKINDPAILEWQRKAQFETSLFEASYESEHVSAEIAFGVVEAHAAVSAGLYMTDADGKMIFNPGVSAEIGASVSAMHAEAEAHVGSEMLGAKVHGEVTAGKVEAKAGAKVSLRDENGNINPTAKIGGSVGAIAGEAKGTLAGTFLGAEVGVTGAVCFGVGAHANVGIENGKVSFDIGASIGLGFSIAFEIDIGGFINTVCDYAQSALV